MSVRFNSRIALDSAPRAALVELLNGILGSALDLYTQLKQAHWNVRGHHFNSRHVLFDKLAQRQREYTDVLAERAGALGGYARGTIRMASASTSLQPFDVQATDGISQIQQLVERYATHAGGIRKGIESTQRIGDPATEDVLIEMLRATEQDMWFLESHLDAEDRVEEPALRTV